MANHHANPINPGVTDREPVVIADVVKAVAALVGAFGWMVPEPVVSSLITLVSAAVFIASTVWTRRKSTSPATLAAQYRFEAKGVVGGEDTDTP